MALQSFLLDVGLFFSFLILYTVDRTLGRGISPSQGPYLHREQHKHRINIHTGIRSLSGIRTHDSSVRVSEDNALDSAATAIGENLALLDIEPGSSSP
jgi:hypothetical protein